MLPYAPLTVAEALATALDQAVFARGRATFAIPGGRSPGPVLTHLASLCSPFVRERLHLLWLDERAVPVGHPDRNDAPTLAAWRAGGADPAHIYPMPAEADDLEAAAVRYGETLAMACQGQPLDAALVGIGEDGHLASLFPHHPGLNELSTVFAVYDSPKPPARRLTMGLSVLYPCCFIAVLALGASKGRILARCRRGADRGVPASLLPAATTVWYADDEAAAAASLT